MSACGTEGCHRDPNIETRSGCSNDEAICMKCKTSPAAVIMRQRDPVCGPCAIELTAQKVRTALRLRIGLDKSDIVMLCYSGGPCSRAQLHLLSEYQSSDKTRPSRSKVAFDLFVVHVDEGCAAGWDLARSQHHVREIYHSIEDYVRPEQFISLRLEDVFLTGQHDDEARIAARQRLNKLIMTVEDSTGREDLTKYLREAVIMSHGKELGATKLAKGDSSDRLAARIIALVSKGNGFALPSTLHFLDARYGEGWPAWVSPCRELLSKDLAMLVHMQRLATVPQAEVPQFGSQASINALSEKFIAGLQVTMPSTVYAVLGTACKLRAFAWNRKVPPSDLSLEDRLCPICSSPIDTQEDIHRGSSENLHPKISLQYCCDSCLHQFKNVLPSQSCARSTNTTENGHSNILAHSEQLLPDFLLERLENPPVSAEHRFPQSVPRDFMRDQIKDFLI